MPNEILGRRTRAPWRQAVANGRSLTLPAFMAYCGIAAALRPWARTSGKAIVTIDVDEDYCREVHIPAAEAFASRTWRTDDWERYAFEWSPKSPRDQMQAEKNQRAIFLSPPGYSLTDDERLFSDAVVKLRPRSPQRAAAALRRAGLPVDAETVDMLISEPWDTLNKAFQDRRHPLRALELLRRLHGPKHVSEHKRPQSRKSPEPTLGDMHGFGPAVEWGLNLAKDLADFRSGLIRWDDVDSGVLISGPPGIGKTMFAGALANTCNVPIVHGSLSRWQEAGALDDHLKAMRASFKEAREQSPSILFIDEIDTIGDRNTSDRNAGYMRGVIAALLEHLDGFVRREGVIVVAACNHPKLVDAAILRAGRLDRHLELTYPQGSSRLAILKYHCGILIEGDNAHRFVIGTEGFSGAEVEQLARGARRAARRCSETLGVRHVLEQLPVLETIKAGQLRTFAVHEAGHALVGTETGHGEVSGIRISKYRISGHRGELGAVEYLSFEKFARTRAMYLNEIALLLGGIAAELEVFGAFGDGASGSDVADLNRATDIATAVEGGLGLGHTLVVEKLDLDHLAQVRLYSTELRRQVHHLLEGELARARLIIKQQRPALDALVERLMDRFALSGDEVTGIIRSNRRSIVSLEKPRSRTAK
jgi:hypothetical protein